mmetsp:Transcript_30333/g.51070  ORF Transcript_30333/g.51070 Transcript_30333/m.51070 type:complete len:206 (+) Transcript_30333:745-1362(+)
MKVKKVCSSKARTCDRATAPSFRAVRLHSTGICKRRSGDRMKWDEDWSLFLDGSDDDSMGFVTDTLLSPLDSRISTMLERALDFVLDRRWFFLPSRFFSSVRIKSPRSSLCSGKGARAVGERVGLICPDGYGSSHSALSESYSPLRSSSYPHNMPLSDVPLDASRSYICISRVRPEDSGSNEPLTCGDLPGDTMLRSEFFRHESI